MAKQRILDIHQRLASHVRASAEALKYVEQAVAYREAGKEKQAKVCERKALYWLRREMAIERRLLPLKPPSRSRATAEGFP